MKNKGAVSSPILALVVMGLTVLIRYIDASVLGEGDTVFLSLAVLQLVILFFPALLYVRIRGISVSSLRLRIPTGGSILFTVSSLFTVIFGSMLISFGLYFLGVSAADSSVYSEMVPDALASRAVFITIAFAVIPAITEEFLCRSVFLSEYQGSGMGTAVFFSALLFSFLHFNIHAFPVYFFSGIILGFVAFVTRSVFCSAAVHLIHNLYILFFEEYVSAMISIPQNAVFAVFIAAALFLFSLFLMLGQGERLLHRHGSLALDRDEPFIPGKTVGSFFSAVANPTFPICAAAYLVLVFLIA